MGNKTLMVNRISNGEEAIHDFLSRIRKISPCDLRVDLDDKNPKEPAKISVPRSKFAAVLKEAVASGMLK